MCIHRAPNNWQVQFRDIQSVEKNQEGDGTGMRYVKIIEGMNQTMVFPVQISLGIVLMM